MLIWSVEIDYKFRQIYWYLTYLAKSISSYILFWIFDNNFKVIQSHFFSQMLKNLTLSGNCCSSSAIGCSDGGGLLGGIIQPDLKIGTKSTTSLGWGHVSRDFVHFSPSEKKSSASVADIVSRNCFND